MIILSIPAGRACSTAHTVLVFGVGLVGSAVVRQLKAINDCKVEHMAWAWLDSAQRAVDAEVLKRRIHERASSGLLSVVWAAGAGGFNSPAEVLKDEYRAFSDVLDLTVELAAASGRIRTTFHLVSSAGGLFEGVRFVDATTLPVGQRSYTLSKLRQEKRTVASLPDHIGLHIHRPSSVYGFRRGGRINLISALIRNGYRHETTTIFGRSSTLRDFIHVSDVGRLISAEVLRAWPGRTFQTLASGKPTSMFEVIHIVESVIGQKLFLRFDTTPTNALDNSFRSSLTGSVAARMALRVGIERTAEAWRQAEFLTPAR